MAKKTLRGGALLAPLPPTMVSCGDMENSNIITIGWTGILNTIPPKTYISVRPTRHSYEMIKEKGEFVINLTPSNLVKEADYCGIYTGKKVNKFEKCKLTKVKGTQIDENTGIFRKRIANSNANLRWMLRRWGRNTTSLNFWGWTPFAISPSTACCWLT